MDRQTLDKLISAGETGENEEVEFKSSFNIEAIEILVVDLWYRFLISRKSLT